MKYTFGVISLFAILLAACNTTDNAGKNWSQAHNGTEDSSPTTTSISGTYWKLTKLGGAVIDQPASHKKTIHFKLNSEGNRVSGYSGCNLFHGNYTLEDDNRIRFSKMASTRMACPDSAINENEVLKVFELVDNYTILGEKLSLNAGKRAPLAVFVAVED